jgi:trigger factor
VQTVDPSTQEEFTSDELRVIVQRKPLCQIEFQVHVFKKLVDASKAEALKSVSKEAQISGFRKGKAPEALILKQYGGNIEKQFHKILGDQAFVEAQKMAKIAVLNQTSKIGFEVQKVSDDTADLLFSFETEPVVPELHLNRFSVKPVEMKKVGDVELEEAIRQMSFFYAQWRDVEDRPVKEGDFIIIDLDTVEGETVRRVFDQIRFEVVPSRMANWMRKLVLNAKIGDVLEGLSEPDADATDEEKREFQPKTVRLYVRKVEEPLLPEINDEFAKKVGAPDVAGMHDLVKGILVSQVENQAKEETREQVNRFLVSQYVFELPRSLLEAEYQHRFSEAQKNHEFRRDYSRMSDAEKKKVQQQIFNESEKSLRLFYLTKQVVQNEKIPITHKEINERAVAQRKSQAMGSDGEGQISQQEYAFALSLVFLTKVQDFMLAGASAKESVPKISEG